MVLKKIPSLYMNPQAVNGLPKITPGMEWVALGEGEATVQMDGQCCAIIGGEFYKWCGTEQDEEGNPDVEHWVRVSQTDPEDQWLWDAYNNSDDRSDGTYEAIGPHFIGNPDGFDVDVLEKHGRRVIKDAPREFAGIRKFLERHSVKGIVFWKDGEPQCKINRTDFGFAWPALDLPELDCTYTEYYDRFEERSKATWVIPDDIYELMHAYCQKNGMTVGELMRCIVHTMVTDPEALRIVREALANMPKLKEVKPLADHRLLLAYENGERRIFNVEPYLKDGWFGNLRDPEYFADVHLSADNSGIQWPDGQNIAPYKLYVLSTVVTEGVD